MLSNKVTVNVNKKLGNWILCKRGLIQGDPLLTFLFIIVVDPPCHLLNHAAYWDFLRGWIACGFLVVPRCSNMQMTRISFYLKQGRNSLQC